MPVTDCQSDGKPGYKCGDEGKCYTYTPGDDASRKAAKKKAIDQCIAMGEDPSADSLTAAELTRLLRRAEQHAENVAPLLEAAVVQVLEQAATDAARGFERHAVNYLTAAAPGVTPQSTMIALKPTPEQAAALALEDGEPAANLHVTLCYLGETTGPLSSVVDALRPVSMRHASLAGVVGGSASFMDGGNGYPVLALPNVPGLVELRVDVTDALVAAGIDYSRTHGFVPHLTLAYMPEPRFVEEAAGQPLTFADLLIVRGDTEIVPLPLAGMPPVTASAHWDIPDGDPIGDLREFARRSFQRGPVTAPPVTPYYTLHALDTHRQLRSVLPGYDPARGPVRIAAVASLFSGHADTLDAIREVAERHQPDDPSYGQVAYHAESRTVFWVTWDGTSVEEQDAAVADFLAIDGVDHVECEAEAALPDAAGWERVYTAALATLDALEAEPLRQRFESFETGCSRCHAQPPIASGCAGWDGPVCHTCSFTEPYPGFHADWEADREEAERKAGDARMSWRAAGLLGPAALTAAGDPTWGMPAADEIIDVDALVASITARTRPVRDAAVRAAMLPVLDRVGVDFDVTNPLVGHVLAQAGSQIVDIAATTQLNVMRIVRRSYEEGLTIPQTASAIREGMTDASKARARLIARTELVGAVNGGSLAAVRVVERATGTTYRKVWMTAPRAKHPRHHLYDGLNGQTVPLAGKFTVGGAELDHPGDPGGPPGEICNCRCTMRYQEGESDDTPIVRR